MRAQLVGIMDGMKAGSLMEGHSWLEEAAAAAEQVNLCSKAMQIAPDIISFLSDLIDCAAARQSRRKL